MRANDVFCFFPSPTWVSHWVAGVYFLYTLECYFDIAFFYFLFFIYILSYLSKQKGKMNQRSFDNEEHSNQYLKNSFLRNLFTWVKMYTEIGSPSLFNFIEWLGSC